MKRREVSATGPREKSPKTKKPLSPSAVVALGFLALIALTAALLMTPAASRSGEWTDPVSALFTATSAVCVTGLVVVDTATHWSALGQCALLLAIQIGGLGVMTVFAVGALLFNKQIGLRQRTILQESVSAAQIGGVVRIVRRALIGTALFEAAGAALLALRFVPLMGAKRGAFAAAFTAVSAFCNAGFDLMGAFSGEYSSLEAFAGDPLVCLPVMALILLGGLGFFVWDDLIESRFRWRRLRLHSRAVLLCTLALTLAPTALFLLTEGGASMRGMAPGARLLASAFSAVTPRTAGFDTVPTASLSGAGKLLTLSLMVVGGNPGSTAGGVKTTTVLLLALSAACTLRGEEDIELMGRRLSAPLLRRAVAVLAVNFALTGAAAFALLAMQPELGVTDVLLEVVSAVNTVGMSAGITRALGAASRLTVATLMYAGRLGSLTFALLLAGRSDPGPVRRPEGTLLIG